jgi:glutathione S-transferase
VQTRFAWLVRCEGLGLTSHVFAPQRVTAVMRLYDYPASCNCYKVRLLLAQLELPYERVNVDIFNGETLTDEFARMNPARTTPVLEIEHGRYLPESNAILAYLGSGSDYLPEDPYERAQVMRWLIYEQTDIVPMIAGLRFRLLVGRLKPSDPAAQRRHAGALDVLSLLERHLHGQAFFVAGRYTIADIAIFGYTHRSHEAGIDLSPYPNVRDWIARVGRQPRFIEDVEPYGANAAPGAGHSIYD